MKYVAVDFETANSNFCSACSIGISVFEDQTLTKCYSYLIKPPKQFGKFNWYNIKIHSITSSMVEFAPYFNEIWQLIKEDIEGSIIVCHNAMFDTAVLKKILEFYKIPIPNFDYVCTVKIAQKVWPSLINHKLDTVSRFLNISLDHHNAESDAFASGIILQAAMQQMNCNDVYELANKIDMRLGHVSKNKCIGCSIAEEIAVKKKKEELKNAHKGN